MATRGKYGKYLRSLIVAGDYVCINVAYLVACAIFNFYPDFFNYLVWAFINISYIPVSSIFSDTHNQRIIYANHIVFKALESTVAHAIMFVALLFFSNNIDKIWVKQIATIYLIMVVIMPIWWIVARKVLKFYRSKGYNFRKVIIVGYGRTGKLLEKELQSDAGYGYKIMGVFDDSPTVAKNTPHYKGTTSDAEALHWKIISTRYIVPYLQRLRRRS